MWRLIILLLGLWPALLRAQCPTMAQRYQRLKDLSALPTPGQIIAEASRLENQSRTCRAITDSVYAKTLHVLGRSYWYAGKLDTAIVLTKQAIAVNQLNRPDVRRANLVHSYYNLGRIYGDKADYKRAIQAFNDAVIVAKQYPEKWASGASAYDEIAFIYYNIGDYEKAVNVAQEGIYLSQRANDPKKIANTLVQQAQALIILNDLPAANASLQKALRIARKISELSITANVYSLLATVASRQQLGQKAIQYYQQAFELNKKTNFRYGCTQALDKLGLVYAKQMGQYDKALTIYKKALVYCDDVGSRISLLNVMGEAQYGLKCYPEALQYYQQALRLIDPLVDSTRFETNPGSRLFRLAAHKEYLLILIQDKADTWLEYAKATNNRQRLQYALNTYKVADQMVDFMRWEHTGQQSKLFWRDKTRGLYEHAIETCHQLGDREQAFRFMEKSRAVMLADKLNELGARQQLAHEQVAEEKHLRQRVSDGQTKLAGLSPDSVRYAPLRMALLASQDSLDGFLKQLEASNPAYYRYKYDNATPSLTDLQQYLEQRQSSLVTYFVGDSALYVMAVTGDTTTLRKQAVGVYTQTLRQFDSLLANADAMHKTTDVSRFLTLSNSLFRQLLAPLALPKGRVVVSPDGSFIPFDALSRSATQPRYAVNDYAFSYVYSASLLLKHKEIHRQLPGLRKRDFLGVAPVDFCPVAQTGAVAGFGCSPENPLPGGFAVVNAPDARSRHAPGLSDPGGYRPHHPFVYPLPLPTPPSRNLHCISPIRPCNLPTSAMVPCSMRSWWCWRPAKRVLGPISGARACFSLARGFCRFGRTECINHPLERSDRSHLSANGPVFISILDQGLPKDIALQRAKQDWLKTADGASQLPNYWAGLIIVGDAQPLSQTNYGLWMAGLALLLVGGLGGWLFLRKRNRRTMPEVSVAHSV